MFSLNYAPRLRIRALNAIPGMEVTKYGYIHDTRAHSMRAARITRIYIPARNPSGSRSKGHMCITWSATFGRTIAWVGIRPGIDSARDIQLHPGPGAECPWYDMKTALEWALVAADIAVSNPALVADKRTQAMVKAIHRTAKMHGII